MTGLVACEIGRATDTDRVCPETPSAAARLMHTTGAGQCTPTDFALCSRHLDAIRGEVAGQLATIGPHTRCRHCGHRITAVTDVVGSVIAL